MGTAVEAIEAPRDPRSGRCRARRAVAPVLGTRAWARILALRAARAGVDLPEAVRTIREVSESRGVPARLAVAVALVETGLTGVDRPGSRYRGWFQLDVVGRPYPTTPRPATTEEAHDLRIACAEFCRAALWHKERDAAIASDPWRWATVTQGVQHALERNLPFARENFGTYLRESDGLLRAYA